MPSVTIRISSAFGGTTTPLNQIPKPKRVSLKQVGGGRSVELPFGPVRVAYGAMGLEYVKIQRPNDVSLLEAVAKKTRTVGMDVLIADSSTSGKTSVQDVLDELELIASEDIDCLFVYGIRTLPFRVRVADFSYESARRDLDGNITQAVVKLQLDERPARKTTIVSLSAIEYDPPQKPDKPKKKKTGGTGTGANVGDDDLTIKVEDETISGPSGIPGYPF